MLRRPDIAWMAEPAVLIVVALVLIAGSADGVQPPAVTNDTMPVEVVSCFDGDTCRVRLPLGAGVAPWVHEMFGTWSVRLLGYDTPEIRGECDDEREMALEARDLLRARVAAAERVELRGVISPAQSDGDPYGRLLGRMVIDGDDVADVLVEAGLARHYDGSHARLPWCEGQ